MAALFEEGYSLPLLVHESIVEDIQTRLDQWRAKLHNDNVISRYAANYCALDVVLYDS